ncbi:MAG: hypothetical protein HWD61_02010 [Parachlamydiaceae bacterium]|nr:MAG: hypothetical protein HWD61_02010 [Parachlamydiaceae bacterium]
MKIAHEFCPVNLIDASELKECSKGKFFNYHRKFLLQDKTDGKVAIISLNIFERIVLIIQKFLCCQTYSKFQEAFGNRSIQIISPSNLEQIPTNKISQTSPSISNFVQEKVANQEEAEPNPYHQLQGYLQQVVDKKLICTMF